MIDGSPPTPDSTPTPLSRIATLLFRIGRVILGTAVLASGIVLLIVPGPGMVLSLAGLALLAPDVPPARRLQARLDRYVPDKVKTMSVWSVVGWSVFAFGAMTVAGLLVLHAAGTLPRR